MLSELREQVVGDESHCAGQGKEHDAEERLRRRKRSRVIVCKQCIKPPSLLPFPILFLACACYVHVVVHKIHVCTRKSEGNLGCHLSGAVHLIFRGSLSLA